ncbi:hypothetical protein JaAD80_07785 [Janthinobacterium sp. AD80]|nr:hypothetical protein JaAD80_07785 [Janthinobacterium sp. AD80]
MLVRDQDHGDAVAVLDFQHFAALFVQQEGAHVDGHLHVDGGRVFLHRLFLDDAQHLQGGRFGIADVAGAGAARARHVRAFGQRRTQALTRQFHQAEARNLAHLYTGTVMVQRIFQALFHFALIFCHFHVDEVDDDQAAQVAQAQLAGHFFGRFAVGVEGGGLDVRAARGARRVDVDGNERFGMVDHDGAARWQRHGAAVRRFNLVFDLEAREQRHVVAVAFYAVHHVGHHVAHELVRLVVDLVGIDQDLADVRLEVVADGADDQRRFLVDQESAVGRLAGAFDGAPQLHQVIQVPLQFIDVAADAGGAGDHGHASWQVQFIHGFAQFLALFTFHAARYATTTRVVRHQHQVAAGQGNKRGQGGALVAALFFFHLDHDFLAFAQRFLDGGVTHVDAFTEVRAGNFLERQEAVAVFAIADEARFERWLDARDDALVDVGFALFAPGCLDIDVDQFLSVDNRYAQFFLLRGIKQHAFHFYNSATRRPSQSRFRRSGEVQGYMRERECWRGKCPGVRSNNAYEVNVTAATGAVRSIVMPSAQDTCNSSETARTRMNCIGGRECKWSANSEPNRKPAHITGIAMARLGLSLFIDNPQYCDLIRGLAKTASVINFINPRARLDKSR